MGFGGGLRKIPVGYGASAAELVFVGGIEEEGGGGFVAVELGEFASLPCPDGFDDLDFFCDGGDGGRRFVAVELSGGKMEGLRESDDGFGSPVDENSYGCNKGWKCLDYFGGI